MSEPIKHTPGPWRLAGGYHIIAPCGKQIAVLAKEDDFPEQEGNARLAISAPNMLALIQAIYDGIHRSTGPVAGMSDSEMADMINDEMCNLFGNDWNKQKGRV